MKLLKHFHLSCLPLGMVTLLFFLFGSTSFSQWWVDGGNLIWPYGNVKITNGDLDVQGNVTINDTIFSVRIGSDWSFLFQGGTGSPQLTIGDTDNEDNYLQLDDAGFNVQQIKIVQLGDWNGENNGTYLGIDIENGRIILNSNLIQFQQMETDSTRCTTGDLWIDAETGTVHRKF